MAATIMNPRVESGPIQPSEFDALWNLLEQIRSCDREFDRFTHECEQQTRTKEAECDRERLESEEVRLALQKRKESLERQRDAQIARSEKWENHLIEQRQKESELSAKIAQRQQHKNQLIDQLNRIQYEIDARRRDLDERRRKKEQEDQKLHQAVVAQAEFLLTTLGMSIEGAGLEDRVKINFTHVDMKDWEREAWLQLDVSQKEYHIVSMDPKLDPHKVQDALDRINQTRDVCYFLKRMRDLFVEALE